MYFLHYHLFFFFFFNHRFSYLSNFEHNGSRPWLLCCKGLNLIKRITCFVEIVSCNQKKGQGRDATGQAKLCILSLKKFISFPLLLLWPRSRGLGLGMPLILSLLFTMLSKLWKYFFLSCHWFSIASSIVFRFYVTSSRVDDEGLLLVLIPL